MASPFPGMDPYLELFWRDMHHRLVTYSCDQIQSQLPRELRARMEERVFVTGEEGLLGHRIPDVHVVEYPARGTPDGGIAVATQETLDLTEPFAVDLPEVRLTETYVEIVDANSGNQVVTVIEFLSPTNKLAGKGREEYLEKRDECRRARVNLVEIDLTRQGPRKQVLPLHSIPSKHHTTYLVCVLRYQPKYRLEYYPIPLPSRLPGIRIPLRLADRDVILRLQPLVEQAYINGRYDDLDYRRQLDPPVEAEELAWMEELLSAHGKR